MRCLFGKLIADPQRLDWFLATVVTEEWHFQHDAGRDLAEMVTERKALFPQEAALIDAYATRFLETIPGPVIGSTELLNRLGERDVPLYAITNFASVFWAEFLPTQPHFKHFRDIVVSGDEKIAKPDRRIFDMAARRFGFAPPEMLFIDDNAANIAAARALNWQVHHFNDVATLEQDLLQRGLL
ncbi:HAD-IA family hydrolase [Novosphingobium fluoreni]|nr:HAD-IA family hydrolase [Novosphingobium fluoreni]